MCPNITCPYGYYQVMKNCKDKKQLRYQVVALAEKEGIKPAARILRASACTVRKWVKRYKEKGYQGLEDESKRPKHSPRGTSEEIKEEIAKLKDKYKRLGAEQVKILEEINISAKTIRKIWREKGKKSGKRKKKHITKKNLREVKKEYYLFKQICEDTKELDDIPEYWAQMKKYNLPKIQYTAREVTTGIQYLGYASSKALIYSTLFAEYINYHLANSNVDLSRTTRQTDNGSEYTGGYKAKEPSAYTLAIESIEGQRHVTIPAGAKTWQADVETVHNLIEKEFFELERFTSRRDFFNKVYTYDLFFNMERPNSYKEGKTPMQLAYEKNPNLDKRVFMIPPVDLDLLLKRKIGLIKSGVYDVSSVP
ncbi:helix-turn-helix domain-containing protein [bacterium]